MDVSVPLTLGCNLIISYAWSCVIYGKHATKAKKKKKSAGTSAWKKALDPNHSGVSNSGSPLSLIMCKAHFHIEIRLHFKRGGTWGRGPVIKSVCFVKRAIASIWLNSCWAEAFSVQAGFTHQHSEYCFPHRVFSTDYMSPLPNVRKRMNPDSRGRAFLNFGSELMRLG